MERGFGDAYMATLQRITQNPKPLIRSSHDSHFLGVKGNSNLPLSSLCEKDKQDASLLKEAFKDNFAGVIQSPSPQREYL